jgi:hypothetical protein
VAVWRRKALELFPFLRDDIQRPDSTVYEVFFLLPCVSDAIVSRDTELLRRMFEFAEWCAGQRAEDLWNAAGVVFYEHLFDGDNWRHRHELIQRLPPWVVADCIGLWEHWLPAEKFAEVRPLLEAKLQGQRGERPTA